MKKQALSLFLAGALALSLFGCSAQPAAESAPQSSPAETAGGGPPRRGGGAAPRDHRRKRHLYHLCGERRIWKDVL